MLAVRRRVLLWCRRRALLVVGTSLGQHGLQHGDALPIDLATARWRNWHGGCADRSHWDVCFLWRQQLSQLLLLRFDCSLGLGGGRLLLDLTALRLGPSRLDAGHALLIGDFRAAARIIGLFQNLDDHYVLACCGIFEGAALEL